MKRRDVLQTLGVATAAFWALPAWAREEKLENVQFFTKQEREWMTVLADTFIPKTETPSASELGVHKFVELMLQDCYGKEEQEVFKAGLAEMDGLAKETFGNSYLDCSLKQREHVLTGFSLLENGKLKDFYALAKGLVVRGYTHTEHYYTLRNFEFAPGYYTGCTDLT